MKTSQERYITRLLGSQNSKVHSFWDEANPRDIKGAQSVSEFFMTLEEVAKEMRVTRERLRQIEARAIKKLQHPRLAKLLKPFLEE